MSSKETLSELWTRHLYEGSTSSVKRGKIGGGGRFRQRLVWLMDVKEREKFEGFIYQILLFVIVTHTRIIFIIIIY